MEVGSLAEWSVVAGAVLSLLGAVVGVSASLASSRENLAAANEQTNLLLAQTSLQSKIDETKGAASEIGRNDGDLSYEVRRLERELESTRLRLVDLTAAAPFSREAKRAKWSSTVTFISGLAVIAIVIGVGTQDWLSGSESASISTGAGIARASTLLASFYLAGQLFRRSTFLQVRAQELERASIGMRTVREVAGELGSSEQRDGLIRVVYERHLAPRETKSEGIDERIGQVNAAKVVESITKLRG